MQLNFENPIRINFEILSENNSIQISLVFTSHKSNRFLASLTLYSNWFLLNYNPKLGARFYSISNCINFYDLKNTARRISFIECSVIYTHV